MVVAKSGPGVGSARKVDWTRMTLGDRLRWIIELRGYTQVEVATKIGMTQAAVSNLVTDDSRKPSAPTLLRLAEALDFNPKWLLDGEGDPHATPATTSQYEVDLLTEVRKLDERGRHALMATARAMAGSR